MFPTIIFIRPQQCPTNTRPLMPLVHEQIIDLGLNQIPRPLLKHWPTQCIPLDKTQRAPITIIQEQRMSPPLNIITQRTLQPNGHRRPCLVCDTIQTIFQRFTYTKNLLYSPHHTIHPNYPTTYQCVRHGPGYHHIRTEYLGHISDSYARPIHIAQSW